MMQQLISVLVSLLVMLLFMGGVGVMLNRMYKRCPSNRAIVRTGIGGIQVSHGTGVIVVPFMHTHGLVSLEPVRLLLSGEFITGKDGKSAWQFTVAVGATRELITTAGTRLLDKDSDEIAQLARDVITSDLSRTATGTNSSRELGEAVEERLRASLGSLGLELISCGPVEIGPEPGDGGPDQE